MRIPFNDLGSLLPALTISDANCDWIIDAFEAVIAASHRVPGLVDREVAHGPFHEATTETAAPVCSWAN
jgi:hypothetical protein